MSASKLVKPAVLYKDSYLEALKEYQDEDEMTFLNIKDVDKNFETFIADINEGRVHLHKPFEDWVEMVPETILWMVKDKTYLGRVNIRHRLNWHLEKWGGHINFIIRPSMRGKGFGKKILQKAMPCASYLGIDKALITIEPENKAAIKVVEFCGGVLEDETTATEQFPAVKRYWLDCS